MYPNDRQWQLFNRYAHCPPPMHPRAFLQRWDLDYPALAKLAGVTRDTVNHWFSIGAGSREPSDHYCQRLASIDFLWRYHEQLPQAWLDLWCDLPEELSEAEDQEDLTEIEPDLES